MTVSLERIFIKYIIKNKRHFQTILPSFFKNPDIQFVYSIIRKWMLAHPDVEVPSGKQIFESVQLDDKDNKITPEIFRAIFSSNLDEYDEATFIKPKFNTWILINRIREGTLNIVDETRSVSDITDFDQAVEVVNKLKSIVDESTKLDFEDNTDLGSDFDDAETHSQDHSQTKVKTGWSSVDSILAGGLDVSTLTILLAGTNVGKSIFMQNFAVKIADGGYNVLYLTLEMSEKKTIKRMGAMRLKIPVEKYDELSLDKDYINKKISNLGKSNSTGGDLFNNSVGKIIVKFFPAGTSTITQFDKLIEDLLIKKGIKIQMVIVDYISLISPAKGVGDNLYQKGKYLAEGLRALAAKYNLPVLTAMQIAKDAWSKNDLMIEDISESKAQVEAADLVFGIIRTEEQKRQNKYRLKLLKIRDGGFDRSNISFDMDPNYLTIGNDIILNAI